MNWMSTLRRKFQSESDPESWYKLNGNREAELSQQDACLYVNVSHNQQSTEKLNVYLHTITATSADASSIIPTQ